MKTGPAFERTRRLSSRKYDGKGAYSPNSHKIPWSAVIGSVFVVGLFLWVLFAGAAAGF